MQLEIVFLKTSGANAISVWEELAVTALAILPDAMKWYAETRTQGRHEVVIQLLELLFCNDALNPDYPWKRYMVYEDLDSANLLSKAFQDLVDSDPCFHEKSRNSIERENRKQIQSIVLWFLRAATSYPHRGQVVDTLIASFGEQATEEVLVSIYTEEAVLEYEHEWLMVLANRGCSIQGNAVCSRARSRLTSLSILSREMSKCVLHELSELQTHKTCADPERIEKLVMQLVSPWRDDFDGIVPLMGRALRKHGVG